MGSPFLKIDPRIARVMLVQYAEHDLKCFSGFACGRDECAAVFQDVDEF